MRRPHFPSRTVLLAATAALTAGCNGYEMFRLAGFAQEDFSNDAELLFVIDNSSSMQPASAALGTNFDGFIRNLVDPTGDGGGQDGLADAVDDYILSVDDRGSVINFQIGVTTTDVGTDYGRLYDFSGESVLRRSTPDVADAFRQNLLCEATCFQGPNGDLPGKDEIGLSSWQCGDDLGDDLFFEYMDCLCGEDVWMNNCGSGTEEGIEATALAMCRGLDPDDESQSTDLLLEFCADKTPFDAAVYGTNSELFREGSTVIPVVVTDAGDGSRRGTQGDASVDDYAEAFDLFGRKMAWAVIGPTVEGCRLVGSSENPQAWDVARYQYFVDDTNGLYYDITQGTTGDCQVADFEQALNELGLLLRNLLTVFPLQSIPDTETILVFVDGKEIPQAEEARDEDGDITYGDGWSYLAAENAVEFHGDAIPDYRAKVRIFYRPLEGMPRTLPF